jgi:MYXO-CTERM domain-containing protein
VRGGTTSFGLMGIDNLSFYLQPDSPNPPTPNPVPEPTGFALAALALLGVGLMSRRRG